MQKLFTVFLLFSIFLWTAGIAAAAPYGEGNYGDGVYGAGTNPTSAPNTDSGSSGGGSSNPSPAGCSNASPTQSPNLFQIDAKNTTVRLYFSPAGSSISSYYLSFGQGNLDEGFGAPLAIDSRGVASYDVTFLKPNTTYTFKIRGANGCAAGPWSESMRIKTTNSAKSSVKYYPTTQARPSVVGTIAGLPGYIKTKVTTPAQPIASNKTQPKAQVASQKPQNAQNAPKPASQPTFFQKILNFFGF